MEYDREKRLGYNGAEEIKNHPFFKGIDWDNIGELKPPFVPQVENEIDTTFFSDTKKFDLKELTDIQNDMDNYSQKLDHFDSTVFDTLAEINKKEAEKAITQANNLTESKKKNKEEEGTLGNDSLYNFDSFFSNLQ